jgi:hypothetical protein
MYVRIGIICIYVLLLGLCMSGIAYVIGMPAQHQLAAIDIVADGGRTIRDIEKNDQGVVFRWISDNRALTIAQPTSAGILTFNYWIAPKRVATAVHINTTTIPLPPSGALTQRRIAMLVFHADEPPQTRIAFQFVAAPDVPIAWAFTSANWQTVTPLPHPMIILGMSGLWLLVALTVYRVGQRHWVGMIAACLSVLVVIFMYPVLATMVTAVYNNPAFWRNSTLIVVAWFLWYAMHPRIVRFLVSADARQRLMIVSYTMLTLAPPLGMLFSPEPDTIVVQENRKLQDCPTQWMGDYWDIEPNFTILSQCISDHIGWRSIMIRSKNELDYRLFGVSSRVYFGKNDFYFLRQWHDNWLPKYQKIMQDPLQHQQLVQLLQSANATYAANNIHMILVIVPTKSIIYSENLPWYALRYNPRMFENLEEELRATGMDVIPVTDILLQHKQDGIELYHKEDIHWNDMGTYHVAQEIVARIALHEQRATPWPKAKPKYHSGLNSMSERSSLSERAFASLFFNRDVIPTSYGINAPKPGNGMWHAESNEYYESKDFMVWRAPTALQQPALPNLVIVGDSFSEYFRRVGMEWYFNKMLWASNYASPIVPNSAMLQIFQQNNVKYVVIELVDFRLLQKFIQRP